MLRAGGVHEGPSSPSHSFNGPASTISEYSPLKPTSGASHHHHHSPTAPPPVVAAPTNESSASALANHAEKLKIAGVVSAYFGVSMSMVFLNKTLLTEGSTIPAPLFVTWIQCIITALLLTVLGEYGKSAPKESFLSRIPPFEFEPEIAKKVLPLTIMFVSMISLNNLCLQYVEVSFYQVARGLTTVFNVLLSYILLGEVTTTRALACCGVILLGFYLGVDNEVNFTLLGTLFGVASSMFVCLNAIYTKSTNQFVDNQYKLELYKNLNAILIFPPLMVLAKEHEIISEHFAMLFDPVYWSKMFIAGLFGFLIGIITSFQITMTSALTHNVAGTCKASVQTLLALAIYRNPVTPNGMLGILLILLGSSLYTYVKSLEMDKRAEANKARP